MWQLGDWECRIDEARTRSQADLLNDDRCECDYCSNFYRNLPREYPGVRDFLRSIGLCPGGCAELYPFEATMYLAVYRVKGEILKKGTKPLSVDGVHIVPKPDDEDSFLLEIGPMELSWTMPVDPEDVISPANMPEFLLKMYLKWEDLSGNSPIKHS